MSKVYEVIVEITEKRVLVSAWKFSVGVDIDGDKDAAFARGFSVLTKAIEKEKEKQNEQSNSQA